MCFFSVHSVVVLYWFGLIVVLYYDRAVCAVWLIGLLQSDHQSDGHGHNKEASGVVPLPECSGVH